MSVCTSTRARVCVCASIIWRCHSHVTAEGLLFTDKSLLFETIRHDSELISQFVCFIPRSCCFPTQQFPTLFFRTSGDLDANSRDVTFWQKRKKKTQFCMSPCFDEQAGNEDIEGALHTCTITRGTGTSSDTICW